MLPLAAIQLDSILWTKHHARRANAASASHYPEYCFSPMPSP
ncbi:hypothetical protein D8I24_1222 [Cupriavidus necator H850]|nr:hypothetical protein D8I24_1222 [Cupriavidus necator H850]